MLLSVFINISLLFAVYPLILSVFSIVILFNDVLFSKIYGGYLAWHRNSLFKLINVFITSIFLGWAILNFIWFT